MVISAAVPPSTPIRNQQPSPTRRSKRRLLANQEKLNLPPTMTPIFFPPLPVGSGAELEGPLVLEDTLVLIESPPELVVVTGLGVASGSPGPRPRQKRIGKIRLEARHTTGIYCHNIAVGFAR